MWKYPIVTFQEDDPPSLEQSYQQGLQSLPLHHGTSSSAKGHRTDSDGTTNSYSSLEDEEAARDDNILEEVVVEDNYLEGDDNGNTVSYRDKIGEPIKH